MPASVSSSSSVYEASEAEASRSRRGQSSANHSAAYSPAYGDSAMSY